MNIDITEIRSINNRRLNDWGVLVNEQLPRYHRIEKLEPPQSHMVAIRSIIATYLLGTVANVATSKLFSAIQDLGIEDFVFGSELELLRTVEPSEDQLREADWVFEYLIAIAWALGRDNIDPFVTDHVNLSAENAELLRYFPRPFTDPNDFVENARLRDFRELYETADLYYRLHWATVENRLRPHGCRLVEPVIAHRRRALEWIIGVSSDWETIPLDT